MREIELGQRYRLKVLPATASLSPSLTPFEWREGLGYRLLNVRDEHGKEKGVDPAWFLKRYEWESPEGPDAASVPHVKSSE
jgi:hypothetical protein